MNLTKKGQKYVIKTEIPPSTEADKAYRQTLRVGMEVATVMFAVEEDDSVLVTCDLGVIKVVRPTFCIFKTTHRGRTARMEVARVFIYSKTKFPEKFVKKFDNVEDAQAFFDSLEGDGEMMAEKTTDLKLFRDQANRGTKCEVFRIVQGQQRIVKGRIMEPAKKGARIQESSGRFCFERWTDIFPEGYLVIDEKPPASKPLAKMGEVLKLPTATQPGKSQYTVKAADPKPASTPEPTVALSLPPAIDPAKAPPRDARTNVPELWAPPEHQPLKGVKKGRYKAQAHALTAVGNIFRAERLKRAWSQKQVAEEIGARAYLISDIELGDVIPDDDTLLHFSERFGVSLDLLLSARDGKQELAADPVAALARIKELEGLLRHANANTSAAQSELSAERARFASVEDAWKKEGAELKQRVYRAESKLDNYGANPALDAATFQAISDFVAKLSAVQPIPTEPEKRAAWYEAALKMFESYL